MGYVGWGNGRYYKSYQGYAEGCECSHFSCFKK
jgi:hypothetical protein